MLDIFNKRQPTLRARSKFGLILYCTALFCTILYKKRRMKEGKIRKFADKEQRTHRQTFQKLKSTLFLYVSSPDTRGSWPICYQSYASREIQLMHRPKTLWRTIEKICTIIVAVLTWFYHTREKYCITW